MKLGDEKGEAGCSIKSVIVVIWERLSGGSSKVSLMPAEKREQDEAQVNGGGGAAIHEIMGRRGGNAHCCCAAKSIWTSGGARAGDSTK